jgi:anti-sigma regulatory factor (Ser/Thr protein kinase)
MAEHASYSLELRNDLSELRRMSAWIHRTGQLMGLANALESDLDVCANEAVLNIINYAYDDSGDRRINIRMRREQDHVDIEIEDDGKPFNPLEFPPLTPASSIEQAPLGGRGIHLIRSLMSACTYQRREGKNILTMSSRTREPLGR